MPPGDLAGSTLGQYQIMDELGRGGMATVYRAWQSSLRRYVAIKVMTTNTLTDQASIERFHHEAVVAANLSHPHIVTVYEVLQQDGRFFIAMEYVEGQSLEQLILTEGRLGLERCIHILRQVADALDYAHKRRFVHRDIKPANIMITPDNRVVITDFGIAKALEGSGATAKLTSAGTVIGSPAYMSPEQIIGQNVDYHTDLYSLGVVTYEMLSGQAPFGGSTTALLYAQVNSAPPAISHMAPGLPAHVEPCLARMLAKQPAARYETATAFVEALATGGPTAQQGRTVAAPPAWNGTAVMPDSYASTPERSNYPTGPQPTYAEPAAYPQAYYPPQVEQQAYATGEQQPAKRRRPFLIIAALAAFMLLMLGGAAAAYFLFLRPPSVAELLEDARAYQASGDDAGAIETYREVLSKEPGQVEALSGIGSVYEAQERWQQAADWYEKWAQEVPDDVDARMALGRMYHTLEDYEAAVRQFERVTALEPSNAEAQETICRAQYALEQYDAAVQACSKALELERKGVTLKSLADSYYLLGDYESALTAYQEWASLEPESTEAYTQVGWTYLNLANYDEAVSAFSRALELEETATAYRGLGNALYQKGDYESAVETHRRLISLEPEIAEDHALIAWSLYHLQRYEEAVPSFLSAVDLVPTARSYEGLGATYFIQGKYEEALDAYQRSVVLAPETISLHNLVGLTLHRLQRYDEAIAAYSLSLSIQETSKAYEGLGKCYYDSGEYSLAAEAYDKWARLDPGNPWGYTSMGWSLYRMEDYTAAIEAFVRSIKIQSTARAHEGLGASFYAQGNYSDALAEFETWASLDPDNPAAHNMLGWASLRLQGCNSARGHFERALKVQPDYEPASRGLAQCSQ